MGNKFDKIIQGIYLGNIDGARDRAGLKAAGITHVVSLKDAPEEMHPGHFLYLLVDAMDVPGFNLSAHFQKCVDFMHEALLEEGSIFIHCMAGISRSTTVTCVYLMTATTLCMNDVMKAIKLKRDVVNPNQGFVKQMREYEREKLKDERIRLAEKFPNSAVLKNRLETEIRAILAE